MKRSDSRILTTHRVGSLIRPAGLAGIPARQAGGGKSVR